MSYITNSEKINPDETEMCSDCNRLTGNSEEINADSLFWKGKIPIVTSSVVVKQLAIILGFGTLFLFFLFLLLDPTTALSIIPGLIFIWIALYLLCLVVGAILQGSTKGGPEAQFAITPEGVGYSAGATIQKLNRLIALGSATRGSLSGTGISMMNIARETDVIMWNEVRSISFQDREQTIVVYRKIFIHPIMLACTAENYEKARELISQYAPPGTIIT
ncbi:MAG: hypothetical protein JXA44_11845 [Methanospirillaceae archaeon]|nr:hypothetical protein [Methanospirillaceae archaeon]